MPKKVEKKDKKPNSSVKKVSNKKTIKKPVTKKSESKNNSKVKNLKRKRGFTLIELIAVLVLLAIVSTIAALSVSSIGSSVKSRQKTNLLSSMQVQAQKYVEQTGIKKVYVDTLIKEGYVIGDKEDAKGNQIVLDPEDNSKQLNCYYYDFTKNADGEISDGPVEDKDGCSPEIFYDTRISIKYCDPTSNDCTNDSNFKSLIKSDGTTKWIKTSGIILKAFDNNKKADAGMQAKIEESSVWTSPLAPDVYTKSPTYVVNGEVVETTYQVRASIDGVDYTTSAYVQIDTKKPTVSNLRLRVNIDDDQWINVTQHIYADFEDAGAGLSGYVIVKDGTTITSKTKWNAISGKTYYLNSQEDGNGFKKNGVYNVYVKDLAGNISEYGSIEITHIDTTKPTCFVDGEGTEWAKERYIKWGCNDEGGSGCESTIYGSKKYTKTTITGTIKKYTIKDNAGNKTTCPKREINVYVDGTAPIVEEFVISSSAQGYNSINAAYKLAGKDDHSGIEAVCYSETNKSANCKWIPVTENTYTGSASFGNTEGTGTKYTRYAFIKDKVGNVSSAVSANYTLYTKCTKTAANTSAEGYGTCSKACGGGIKYLPLKDLYLGIDCGLDKSQTCNEFDCCSKLETEPICDDWQWTECNVTCGYGTRMQYCTCYYYSYYDDTLCKTENKTQNFGSQCYAGECPPPDSECDYRCTTDGKYQEKCGNGTWNTIGSCDKDCGDYDKCSKTCGTGTKKRTCWYYKGSIRSNDFDDYADCTGTDCGSTSTCDYRCTTDGKFQKKCGNSGWSTIDSCTKQCQDYGTCNPECGPGTKSRTCRYTYNNGYSSDEFIEKTDCKVKDCEQRPNCYLYACSGDSISPSWSDSECYVNHGCEPSISNNGSFVSGTSGYCDGASNRVGCDSTGCWFGTASGCQYCTKYTKCNH